MSTRPDIKIVGKYERQGVVWLVGVTRKQPRAEVHIRRDELREAKAP